jgi:hypothetical protein
VNPSFSDRLLGFWLHVGMILAANPAWLIAAIIAVAYLAHLTSRLETWIGKRVAEHAARRTESASEPETPAEPEPRDEMHGSDSLLGQTFDHRTPPPPTARRDQHRPPTRPAGHRITRLRRDRHRNRV